MSNRPFLPTLVILLFLLFFSGCRNQNEDGNSKTVDHAPEKVETVMLTPILVADQIEIMGNVQAADSAVISSRLSGNISEILVSPGSFVRQDEKLLQIRAEEISAKLLQAKAQLNQAKRNLEREKKLLAKKAATPEAVKSLEETLEITQANYDEAKTMLGYTVVTAPFDGRITRKLADVGDLAEPGKQLFHLENEDNVQVVADVPETLVNNVHMGMKISLSVPSASLEIEGTVAEIAPIADRQSYTVNIKIDIEKHPSLRSGQFARVSLPGRKMQTILIPVESIRLHGQMEKVFIAVEGKARLRLIRTGKVYPQGIEILSGLTKGDTLIIHQQNPLHDGQSITFK
jgi:RND family efflux transporter MFP subunit